MFPRFAIALGAALLLSGCLAIAPKTAEQLQAEQVQTLLDVAREALTTGDIDRLGDVVHAALGRETGPQRIREFFAATPRAQHTYATALERAIDAATSAEQLTYARSKIVLAETSGAVPKAEAARLLEKAESLALAGLRRGTLNFNLANAEGFSSISSERHLLAQRTVAQLPTASFRAPLIQALVKYIREVGPEGQEGRELSTALLAAPIRRSELPLVEETLPQLAARAKEQLFAKAVFVLKGGDRLLADDIKSALSQRLKGVVWVAQPDPGAHVVTVEKIRHEEKTTPEARETITYAQHQVNLVAAALLMPRNASYSFERLSSSAEIDYGYAVLVEGPGGAKAEEVVRGTARTESVRCSNARIQNVFGGVTAADFVANEDMARRCSGGSGRSLAELRADVYSLIADAVAKSAPLRPFASAD